MISDKATYIHEEDKSSKGEHDYAIVKVQVTGIREKGEVAE